MAKRPDDPARPRRRAMPRFRWPGWIPRPAPAEPLPERLPRWGELTLGERLLVALLALLGLGLLAVVLAFLLISFLLLAV